MKDIKNKIVIKATSEKVWDILTNPAKTPEYMYTCAIETNFKEGSPVLWCGIHDQNVYVSGTVKVYQPYTSFVYTVIDPNEDYEMTEENHLLVSYELESKENKTLLTVTQSGYENAAKGKERYEEVVAMGGWSSILETIKEIAER